MYKRQAYRGIRFRALRFRGSGSTFATHMVLIPAGYPPIDVYKRQVTNEGIQSVEGAYDARLLLKRLAAKMTVAWNNNLTDKTYAVKEDVYKRQG